MTFSSALFVTNLRIVYQLFQNILHCDYRDRRKLRFHDIFIDKQTTNYSWIGEEKEKIPLIYVIWSFYLKGWQTQSKIEKHLILYVSFHLQFPLPRTKTAFLHAGARDASRKC